MGGVRARPLSLAVQGTSRRSPAIATNNNDVVVIYPESRSSWREAPRSREAAPAAPRAPPPPPPPRPAMHRARAYTAGRRRRRRRAAAAAAAPRRTYNSHIIHAACGRRRRRRREVLTESAGVWTTPRGPALLRHSQHYCTAHRRGAGGGGARVHTSAQAPAAR
jgi:hypothetical protein